MKKLIGMVHLGYFPNDPKFTNHLDNVKSAIHDISVLQQTGFDAMLIENRNDTSHSEFISQSDYDYFDKILGEVREYITIECGINVLPNDYKSAYELASKYELDFIQIDVSVDEVITDYTYSTAPEFGFTVNKNDFAELRHKHPKIKVFGGIQPKHYRVSNGNTFEQSLKLACSWPLDTIVVTGNVTGAQASLSELELAWNLGHQAGKTICIGSGVNKGNLAQYLQYADCAIVGTSIKDSEFKYIVESQAQELVSQKNFITSGDQ